MDDGIELRVLYDLQEYISSVSSTMFLVVLLPCMSIPGTTTMKLGDRIVLRLLLLTPPSTQLLSLCAVSRDKYWDYDMKQLLIRLMTTICSEDDGDNGGKREFMSGVHGKLCTQCYVVDIPNPNPPSGIKD